MHDVIRDSPQSSLSRALKAALAILLLTSVHHAYGAMVYGTLWRLHVLIFAGLTAVALWAAARLVEHHPVRLVRGIAMATFCLVDLVLPVAGIGFFEGGYNHVLKNVMYFGGSSPQLVTRLFPPPTYELPNDWFFEGTGILQFGLGIFAAYQLNGLLRRG